MNRSFGSIPSEGSVTVVVDAPVIMQLKLLQSLLFMLLVVPQIQFNFRVPDVPVVCTHLTGAGHGGIDVPVNRSDKFQQFTFVGRLRVHFGRNACFDSGYMLCYSFQVLLDVLAHLPREGDARILTSICPALRCRGVESVHSRCFSGTAP